MTTLCLEMTFDFICPWSLFGKRNLESALRLLATQHPNLRIRLEWLGLQLLPQVAMEGEPFSNFKLHCKERFSLNGHASRNLALGLALGSISNMPNTTYAHRVFQRAGYVGTDSQRDRLLELLFLSHFQLGENIGLPDTLVRLLRKCDFKPSDFDEALTEGASHFIGRRVALTDANVPMFLHDGRAFARGAQSLEQLQMNLQRIVMELPLRTYSIKHPS